MLSPPLSLYIHMPWCISKCPYCDFNSHTLRHPIPEQAYLHALIADLETHLRHIQNRPLISIFIGGGTPSLISPDTINKLLTALQQRIPFSSSIEITMEANPNSIDRKHFAQYRQAGINRLSIGVQSFCDQQLKRLGRAHHSDDARHAIEIAQDAGFTNINIDIMHGLPQQSIEQALSDLKTALDFNTPHLSWYQLTLEPNTPFYHQPPTLPEDDSIADMQHAGQSLLRAAQLEHYEISAFAKPGYACQHNVNYWQFGDYIGIGAGAHGKITDSHTQTIQRYAKIKYPNLYIQSNNRLASTRTLSTQDLCFEFMLNHLRLRQPIPLQRFTERTGLTLEHIQEPLEHAAQQGFLTHDEKNITLTPLGKRFVNDVVEGFLE